MSTGKHAQMPAATEGCAAAAGYATGPLVWMVKWDSRGHWITGKHAHTNHLWLWIGPTRSQDRLTIYNLVIGPLGIAVGWRGWHTDSSAGTGEQGPRLPGQ